MVNALLEHFDITVPQTPGKDTFACMEAAHAGEVDFALLVGGNLYAANPDLKWAAEAPGRIRFTAFLSTTLNLGHIHGRGKNTLALPVRVRDEEKQSTSQESMFNYVRLLKGGQLALGKDLPSESEIFAQVGRKYLLILQGKPNEREPQNEVSFVPDFNHPFLLHCRIYPNSGQLKKIRSARYYGSKRQCNHCPKTR